MSGSIAKKLRIGIIDKLKQYDCYIDNELPDYIMVLIANKKSSGQMKEDLSLFVGDHVSEFVDWLNYCLEEIKLGSDPFTKETAINENEEIKQEGKIRIQSEHHQKNVSKSNELSSTKSIINSSSNISSNTPINTSLNEESKENSLKDRPVTRKLIKFTNEDNKDKNNGQINNPVNQQKNLIKEEINQPKASIKSQHKRIVYNLNDNEDNNVNDKKSLNKRFKSQVSITTISKPPISAKTTDSHENNYQTNKRNISNLNSKINYDQQLNPNRNSNLKPTSPTNLQSLYYQKRSSFGSNQQSSSNQQFYNNSHSNNNQYHNYPSNHFPKTETKHQTQQHQPLNILERIKRENQSTESILERIKKENQVETKSRSMVFKAIEEANKQSNLESISLRKQEKIDSDSSVKTPLISRLGRVSSTNEKNNKSVKMVAETEDIQKEKRLIKFKKNEPVKQDEVKQNEIKNSEKIDLRKILERKRKLSGEDKINSSQSKPSPNKLINRLVISESKVSNDDIKDDTELKILKDKIKSKSSLIAENKKEDDKNNEVIKEENTNSTIKHRELMEKIENIQGLLNEHKKLKSLSAVNQSNKEVPPAKRERCYFWPVCSNQDKCQYHHPKNLCKQFPLCKYGEKCLNIHPNCKFDSKCVKIDCPYTHLTRKLQASKTKPLQSTIQKTQLVSKKVN